MVSTPNPGQVQSHQPWAPRASQLSANLATTRPGTIPGPRPGVPPADHLLQELSITNRGWLKSHLIGPHPGPSESGSPSSLRFGHSLNQNPQSKHWWKVQSFLPCLGFAQGWTSNMAVPHTVGLRPLLCKIRKQIGICNRYEQDDGNTESKMPPVPRSYPTPCHVCKELISGQEKQDPQFPINTLRH